MKMFSRASLILLAATALTLSARGDELDPPQMGKLTPQMQARLLQLLGAGELASSEAAASASASPAGGSRLPRLSPISTALHTGSLRTGRLETSGSLSGAPRLNEDEWRQLFPLRR